MKKETLYIKDKITRIYIPGLRCLTGTRKNRHNLLRSDVNTPSDFLSEWFYLSEELGTLDIYNGLYHFVIPKGIYPFCTNSWSCPLWIGESPSKVYGRRWSSTFFVLCLNREREGLSHVGVIVIPKPKHQSLDIPVFKNKLHDINTVKRSRRSSLILLHYFIPESPVEMRNWKTLEPLH